MTIVTDQVTPMLDMLDNKLSDMTEFVLEVGQLWSDEMAFNFATANWPPLAAATIAEKAAAGYPLAPLFRTQALRDAAVGGEWQASGGGGSATAVLEGPSYAAFHLEGTRFMPVRDFAFLESAFDGRLADVMTAYFFNEVTIG